MPKVIPFIPKAEAKAIMQKALANGQSKAKTAITSPGQQKIAAKFKQKMKDAQKTKAKLTAPGEWARCRAIVGGDYRAAALLYRVAHLWRVINPKMRLSGGSREYLAMNQAEWETSCGLGTSELKNYALPILKECGFPPPADIRSAAALATVPLSRQPRRNAKIQLPIFRHHSR